MLEGKDLDMNHHPKKQYSPDFKLKVVLESMQRDTTQEEVCRKFGIVSSMLHCWRKEFQEHAPSMFLDKRDPKKRPLPRGMSQASHLMTSRRSSGN
jgi:transposase